VIDKNGLEKFSHRLRVHTIRMTHRAKASHVASSLSMAELLAVLYTRILQVDPENPDCPERTATYLEKAWSERSIIGRFAAGGTALPISATGSGR